MAGERPSALPPASSAVVLGSECCSDSGQRKPGDGLLLLAPSIQIVL